ncbi:UDP-N-acetylmuramyl pentapeptide phosphotransferase/UDP-N-acetylglucosamine-1-phosphate transferase [Pyrodictium delaneyi]|uniref:UDP-N-acetylmuramyl pentapeptide phosphotransferase/UDP-N-acetylglucosamine-1-phosphate transferase n=1 Tax=Pyrodictium delaneyi TaxID=1273541 RepID=A0A0P0N6D5_9CREN|nr:glycosyltransferase 4 family protein [Pyrodictium delaneyi]ALL01979.1 UDP-N-acetylmuramyl pentapeptide phosphotransferase/UDP-N-acetylglucosamine-1-phosphate transferase [Pyrodictium delaneyi]
MALVYALASGLVAFALVLVIEPAWIRVARARGLVGQDMNKPGKVMVAEAGGIWAVVAAAFGLLALEALYTYLEGAPYRPAELYALVALLLLASLLGFIDDILGWKRGLPRWQRVAFMAPVSLPLVVIKAGKSTLSLPLIGTVDLGAAYPLVAVPVGVLGAANAFNMLAGYNGLEAGMGLLLMLFTAAYAALKGLDLVLQAALVMAAALLGFLRYNWYPARVFPGNAFTYGVGAYYAALVILGNMEKFGLVLFTLYFVKALLYFRGVLHGVWRPGIEDFGVPRPDGSLEPPLQGAYSLQHLAIRLLKRTRGRATEKGVVLVILLAQAVIGLVALVLALEGLL